MTYLEEERALSWHLPRQLAGWFCPGAHVAFGRENGGKEGDMEAKKGREACSSWHAL